MSVKKFVSVIIQRLHHVSFASLPISRLRTRSHCVAVSMDTHVGLNVATRICDVYPDKCWFAVLCRFWFQCSRTLMQHVGALEWCLHLLGYLNRLTPLHSKTALLRRF